MKKHAFTFLVALATTTLAGCQLYFGEDDDDGAWTYCGSDGYYECNGDDCYWRGSECPTGTEPGTPPGFECSEDSDCAAGCYCGNGICEEAGFCTQDSDCGNGYTCDESRSSCTPNDSCAADSDCTQGEYCNPDNLQCEATCTCTTDAEAVSGGYDYCDESRGTCLAGVDPAGDCAGELTCNLGRPTCPAGSVALIAEGCYTGECQAIAACASAPACAAFGHEADCRAASCGVSYTGINCRKPDNTPCQAGDTNCTCDSYVYASCYDSTTPRTTVEFNGYLFDVSELTLRN